MLIDIRGIGGSILIIYGLPSLPPPPKKKLAKIMHFCTLWLVVNFFPSHTSDFDKMFLLQNFGVKFILKCSWGP